MREATVRRIIREELAALKSQEIPKLLTPSEVAEALKLEVQTLATWRYKGVGPKFRKIGSNVLYEAQEVAAFIATA